MPLQAEQTWFGRKVGSCKLVSKSNAAWIVSAKGGSCRIFCLLRSIFNNEFFIYLYIESLYGIELD